MDQERIRLVFKPDTGHKECGVKNAVECCCDVIGWFEGF